MNYEELIRNKLDMMTDSKDKALLLNLVDEFFLPIYKHSQEQYRRLEERVEQELPYRPDMYYIWTTVSNIQQAESLSPYLFPMCAGDFEEKPLSIDRIQESISNDGCFILKTVFMTQSTRLCETYAHRSGLLSGSLNTGNSQIPIKMHLRPANRYLTEIERLHTLFVSNGVPWMTVNAPYIRKFYDVVITKLSPELEGHTINGFEVDFGEYTPCIVEDMIPLWNVQQIHVESSDFPVAVVDKKVHEFHFNIEEEGTEHGYLVNLSGDAIISVRREEKEVIVSSSEREDLEWDVLKIHRRHEFRSESFPYPLGSNLQSESVASRLIHNYGLTIKTKAEITRLIMSYEASNQFSLEEIQILGNVKDAETYNANPFLIDEIRDGHIQQSMLLRFKRKFKETFADYDVISFLTSELQLVYPEYHCVGVIV